MVDSDNFGDSDESVESDNLDDSDDSREAFEIQNSFQSATSIFLFPNRNFSCIIIRMKNIAVLVYDLTVEYNIVVTDGVLDFFKDKGDDFHLIISTINAPHATSFDYDYQYWTALELLKSDNIDAVIVVTNSFCHDLTIPELSKALECLAPKPVVSISNPLDIPTNHYTCVSCQQAYEEVVEHLSKKHNRKKIAFLSAALNKSPESEERENAYKAALKKFGLEYNPDWDLAGDFTPRSAYDAILGRYKKKEDIPFDALLCANDYMAAGSLSAFLELGVKVPEDICIFGFDDAEVATNASPTLSTISQSVAQTGYEAGALVYDILMGKKDVPKSAVIQSFSMYRQSCGCIDINNKIRAYINNQGEFIEQGSADMTQLQLFNNGLNDMATIYHILNMSDTVVKMRLFFNLVVKNLNVVHIGMMALCVYDEPIELNSEDDFVIPEKANMVMLIDESRHIEQNYFDQGGIEFNPKKQLLPDGLEELAGGNYYLLPIFLQKNNYGYLVCRFPTNKYPIYTIFLKILVNAFVHSYIYSKTEQERALMAEKNQTLNFQSKTDELTQLFNRRGFFEYGQQLLDFSLIDETCGCVFFCDLDGLKTINDTWGHDIGDLAIKTEAKVLRAAFRDSDLIGRLSGDEFGVVSPGCPARIVERMRERFLELNEQFSQEAGLPFTLSISIGAMEYSGTENDLNKLLTQADKDLYKEKKRKHALRDKNKAKT